MAQSSRMQGKTWGWQNERMETMTKSTPESRIIVALDYGTRRDAEIFVDKVSPQLCKLKVGKELFTVAGPALVKNLVARGFDVFLDLKFHDIPHTVAQAVEAAADLGVWMTNVHALGGSRMMVAARDALDRQGSNCTLIAVTVLTSMNAEDLRELGIQQPPEKLVMNLASLANRCGLDGVVCSGQETEKITQALGEAFLKVTPGIRPTGYGEGDDDQRRTLTPAAAIAAGSNFLVIGRPVTGVSDPTAALLAIRAEIGDD